MSLRGFFGIILLLLLLSGVSGLCDEGQVDINAATAEELQRLKGIGPVYSERIIDLRPYTSLDELIAVKGIGEVTLQNIKEEGLACISEEDRSPEEDDATEKEESHEESRDTEPSSSEGKEPESEPPSSQSILSSEPILLEPKDIKTTSTAEKRDIDYAFLGIITLGLFMGLVVAMKYTRKDYNEFD